MVNVTSKKSLKLEEEESETVTMYFVLWMAYAISNASVPQNATLQQQKPPPNFFLRVKI